MAHDATDSNVAQNPYNSPLFFTKVLRGSHYIKSKIMQRRTVTSCNKAKFVKSYLIFINGSLQIGKIHSPQYV